MLFLQCTEAGAYPPVINAALVMAEAGWDVSVLSAPWAGMSLAFPSHPRVACHAIAERQSYIVGKADYARYLAAAARLARFQRPDVVYASDPLGSGPGLLAARLAGARLAYHEHDGPASSAAALRRLRRTAARAADVVVFPNAARAEMAQRELALPEDRLHLVWNLPRQAEVATQTERRDAAAPLVLYYHGSISPDRLPLAVVQALRRFEGAVRLRIAGYEAPSAAGHVARLLALGRTGGGSLVDFIDQVSRADLIAEASRGDVGLAFMPMTTTDLNMRHMTGASNKAFDYMAAGLPMLVSDLTDWRRMFAGPGYARACDPTDPGSVAAAIGWMLERPEARRRMGERARARIKAEWNYETAFAPVLDALTRFGPPANRAGAA